MMERYRPTESDNASMDFCLYFTNVCVCTRALVRVHEHCAERLIFFTLIDLM